MNPEDLLRVDIVINNYNYARFLSESIESALAQTYPNCAVIVVDDGSTDDSMAVIAPYTSKVLVSRIEHGGQAAALNEGWRLSRGEFVLFLDADDALKMEAISRAVGAFAGQIGVTKVQFPLEYVDSAGQPLGQRVPNKETSLPHGNLASEVLRYGDDIAWSPMSGNLFFREFLRRVMPIPVSDYPEIGADIYLINLAPLYGAVTSLPDPGGAYRVHGGNAHFSSDFDIARTQRLVALTEKTHEHMRRHAASLGIPVPLRGIGTESLMLAAHRLVLTRLGDEASLAAQLDAARVAMRGCAVAIGRSDRPWRIRLLFLAWFLAVAVVPRSVARRLAQRFARGSVGF